ncbi:GntR family transcriptional regulator [Bordetella sp. BOR01]|uniref:GntR family transcriptional regulator n=1 Tax=Bordetella sp. BOR01 TaxID=2854779 RepID=UPI001C4442B0|nr:GntR family transcriptional regulator [Bordetella sp. BOR01]MBV7482350.1 GntR family transcriptional regulator [Bordetella sp. BOR01]
MASPADPDAPLDRSSGHPLHVQVAQALRRDIRGRQWAPGTVLPSEAVLCQQFGVARSVVRQALAALVAEGLIRRDPGRAPTVAPALEHHRMVQRSTGLFEQFANTGTALLTRVLHCEPAAPPPDVAAFFGSDDTLLLERLRRVDDEPLAFVRTWLPRARLPGLSAAHLQDTSLHRTLVQRFGLHPGRGRNRIRAVGADAALASVLQVPAGSPLLMLEGQGFDQHGQPLEWFTTWHRAEKLVFDVDVSPAGEHIQAALPRAATATAAIPDAAPVAPQSLEPVEAALSAALDTVRRLRRGET